MADVPQFQPLEIGPGFWNVRSPFKVLKGLLDVGTHMSVVQLESGRFVFVDAVDTRPELLEHLDRMTDNGRLLDAVLATHPFHTVYFPRLHARYPNAKYYGCPRHLRKLPTIPWAGDLNDPCVRKRWEPDLQLRIPAGAEFVNPQPESWNHFVSVFVFHSRSRSLHNNDTVGYTTNPGLILRLAGARNGSMSFHPSLKGPALKPHEEAPWEFKAWVQEICRDWDFDNIITAHNSNLIGGAKQKLLETLAAAEPTFQKLANKRKGIDKSPDEPAPEPHAPAEGDDAHACG